MLEKLKQAQRMLKAQHTIGDIMEVTGLNVTLVFCLDILAISPERVYICLPRIREDMTSRELEELFNEQANAS